MLKYCNINTHFLLHNMTTIVESIILTSNDFHNKVYPEPPLCVYERVRYGVGTKYMHEDENIKRKNERGLDDSDDSNSSDSEPNDENTQTIDQMMSSEYGLMNCSSVFLPNNNNIYVSFGQKFDERGLKDVIGFCMRNKIYPQNDSLAKFIEEKTGQSTIKFDESSCSYFTIRPDIHTNMKYQKIIPDNTDGKVLIEIWDKDKKVGMELSIEDLCEFNGINKDELEQFMIQQLHEYYKNPSVFKYQVFCGCCFNSHVPDPTIEVESSGHDGGCIIC